MKQNRLLWIILGIITALIVIVVVTLALTPDQTSPAFAAAVSFMEAAGKGDDAAAYALLDAPLQAYVDANCPDGSVSACIAGYTPAEWGPLVSAVFRRAAPEGPEWNVDLIAMYAEDKGFSGVCIYHRMVQDEAGQWRVARWAGFLPCDDAASRNMATNPDTPNRAP